jgi:hypothetical protein
MLKHRLLTRAAQKFDLAHAGRFLAATFRAATFRAATVRERSHA